MLTKKLIRMLQNGQRNLKKNIYKLGTDIEIPFLSFSRFSYIEESDIVRFFIEIPIFVRLLFR